MTKKESSYSKLKRIKDEQISQLYADIYALIDNSETAALVKIKYKFNRDNEKMMWSGSTNNMSNGKE